VYPPFTNAIELCKNITEDFTFAIGQKEKCPTTGREHIQMYVQFARKCRGIKKLQDLLGPCHVEIARGTAEQNIAYCSKDDTRVEGPWRSGNPSTQGRRNDILAFRDAIKSGSSDRELAESHFASYIKYHRSVPKLRQLFSEDNTPKYKLSDFDHEELPLDLPTLVWGYTAFGKSHFALAHFKNPMLVTHLDQLENITDKHDGLVFDDMDFRHLHFTAIINLLDIEMDRHVHIRYTTAKIRAGLKRIFTFNNPDIFSVPNLTDFQKDAIARRISVVEITYDIRKIPEVQPEVHSD